MEDEDVPFHQLVNPSYFVKWVHYHRVWYSPEMIRASYAHEMTQLLTDINSKATTQEQFDFIMGPPAGGEPLPKSRGVNSMQWVVASRGARLMCIKNISDELAIKLINGNFYTTNEQANAYNFEYYFIFYRQVLENSYSLVDRYDEGDEAAYFKINTLNNLKPSQAVQLAAANKTPITFLAQLTNQKLTISPAVLNAALNSEHADKEDKKFIKKTYAELFKKYQKFDKVQQLALVQKNGRTIKTIFEMGIVPDEDVMLAAVKQNGHAIIDIYDAGIRPSQAVVNQAVSSDIQVIYVIKPEDIANNEILKMILHDIEHTDK